MDAISTFWLFDFTTSFHSSIFRPRTHDYEQAIYVRVFVSRGLLLDYGAHSLLAHTHNSIDNPRAMPASNVECKTAVGLGKGSFYRFHNYDNT